MTESSGWRIATECTCWAGQCNLPLHPLTAETRRLAGYAYGWDGPSQEAISAAKRAVAAEKPDPREGR